jgi:hypothetical protein
MEAVNTIVSKLHALQPRKAYTFYMFMQILAGFSLLPNRLSPSTLTSPGSEGVALEKLNQTWPPPSSGNHSPRIPKTSSKRGRRILEPLNSGNPHDGNIET